MLALQERNVTDDLRNEVHGLWQNGQVSDSDVKGDKDLRTIYRSLAKKSLYFLTKAVLGYDLLTKRTHLEYCRFLQDLTTLKTLDLMPRGTYKTTIGTIAFPLWCLLHHPEWYILIANQKAENAERMLVEIEQHCEGGNSMMAWLFPEYIRPGNKHKPWSQGAMTVPCRGDHISGTPSIVAFGVGSRTESWHFNVIINDDLIGEKDMSSSKEMMNAIIWHDYSLSLFVSPKHGIERMHGTRWDLSDLYSVVLDTPGYAYYVRAAKDPVTGELFFPELLDDELLRAIRDQNYALYMSQYMNDPENPEVLDFRLTWLKRYKLVKTPQGPACEMDGVLYYVKDMDVRMAVDPAASGDIQSNLAVELKRGRAVKANNCVGIWGLHGSGYYFLLDLWTGRGKGDNPELQVAERMYQMVIKWLGYVRKGHVEAYGAQRALITIFNMLCKQNSFAFPMEETPRGIQTAKKVRIRTYLGANAQNGLLCVRSIQDAFIHEFSQFPQSLRFDTLDMSAWAMYHLQKPWSEVESTVVRKVNEKLKNMRRLTVGVTGY